MRCWTLILVLLTISTTVEAAPPVVKTVPWVPNKPLKPHDTWSGKTITLKGTCDMQGGHLTYTWDFGDGSPVATGTVNNQYVIEAKHAYSGPSGLTITARLTIKNNNTGEVSSKEYYVTIQDKTLPVEVNVAIDEGLWYLHKNQIRSGADGYWQLGGSYNGGNYYCSTAAAVNAFEVNGHTEIGSPDNPYTDTVMRGMRRVFMYLTTYNISNEGMGNPDSNGNGFGIKPYQSNPLYQAGMFMDAIVASGTPDATAPSGPANINGRKYRDIVQDMVDYYAFAQYNHPTYGGWRYNENDFPDNSACQWAAIGIIAAERNWGCAVPAWMKAANNNWLSYSQWGDGNFFYQYNSWPWGTFATTPSGLVQMAMNGNGRGDTRWDKAEAYLRNNYANAGNHMANIKAFYYGLFSFEKAMLLHDSNKDGIAEPIKLLHSPTMSPDIDWYAAEKANGDPTDGVARTLVNDQLANGNWPDFTASFGLGTQWAIIMLHRTLFDSGSPVAVAKANPNPTLSGVLVQLDGSASFHQDGSKLIAKWEWDFNNDGTFDFTGPFATVSYPTLGQYPVTLKVTDNGSPAKSAETTVIIKVTMPPIAPTADAGGPYNLCLGQIPWYLDGSQSTNPDDGAGLPSFPGDFIKLYEWDLDGDGQFDDAIGAKPDVTAFFVPKGPGNYLIQLRVTDNSAVAFNGTSPDLISIASATVTVRDITDLNCVCVNNLAARAKPGKIQLTWKDTGAHHYNVCRSTVSGGPYQLIASTTSTYSIYLDQVNIVNGATYYYVVREATFLNEETCQSNEAKARAPLTR